MTLGQTSEITLPSVFPHEVNNSANFSLFTKKTLNNYVPVICESL